MKRTAYQPAAQSKPPPTNTSMSNQPATTKPATERLPAFLRRRNGRLELVLHCTWVQDYYVCPRKFFLRYDEQVEGTGPRAALNYGGAIHEALAHRYRSQSESLSVVEEVQMHILAAWFDAHPQPSDEWRNAGRAQDLIRAYNAEYPTHEWDVLAVEEEFEVLVGEVAMDDRVFAGDVAMTKPTTVPAYLAGRKDLVVAWHHGIWIVDHKTASDWGSGESNSHLDEGRRNFQFRGYAWAERERQRIWKTRVEAGLEQVQANPARYTLPVLGTVGNYLVSRKPYATDRKPAKATPRNQFHMECYPFEASVLDEWHRQFLRVASQILAQWSAGTLKEDHHDTGCGHWGRCEFYDYCEEAPDRREAMLSSTLFQPKVIERDL